MSSETQVIPTEPSEATTSDTSCEVQTSDMSHGNPQITMLYESATERSPLTHGTSSQTGSAMPQVTSGLQLPISEHGGGSEVPAEHERNLVSERVQNVRALISMVSWYLNFCKESDGLYAETVTRWEGLLKNLKSYCARDGEENAEIDSHLHHGSLLDNVRNIVYKVQRFLLEDLKKLKPYKFSLCSHHRREEQAAFWRIANLTSELIYFRDEYHLTKLHLQSSISRELLGIFDVANSVLVNISQYISLLKEEGDTAKASLYRWENLQSNMIDCFKEIGTRRRTLFVLNVSEVSEASALKDREVIARLLRFLLEEQQLALEVKPTVRQNAIIQRIRYIRGELRNLYFEVSPEVGCYGPTHAVDDRLSL